MALRTKVKALLAGGASAIVIAAAMLGGNHGLEGRRHEPYRDVAGVLTVCDGHTGKDILPGKHYTDAECDALLNKDLALVAARIDPLIKASIPNSERAALYSFAYNVGNQSPTDNDKAKGAASVKTQPVTASVTQPSDADRRSVTNRGIT